MRITIITIFIFLCLITGSFGEKSPDTRESTLNSLYELGILTERFSNSGVMIHDLVAQLTDASENRAIAGVLSDLFDEAPLERWAKESISRNFRMDEASQLLRYAQENDLHAFMHLIYAGNIDFDDENMQDALQRFLIQLDDDPLGEDRFQLITGIIQKTRMLQIQVQMIEDVITTVIFALNVSLAEEERLSDREVNELVVTLRLNFRELFNNVLPLTLLFATRDIPLETLEKHSTFFDSDSGRWFIRTINTAALDSFGEFTQVASAEIAEWMLTQTEIQANEQD